VKKLFDPYENANLKLFAAMSEMRGRTLTPDSPLMLELVQAYARIFPDEKAAIYEVFINTTFGATMSSKAANIFDQLARTGRVGNMRFVDQLAFARKFLQDLIQQAVAGGSPLNAQMGQEIWVLNSNLKIGRSVWEEERTIPLTLNLNTATIPELMTLPGVS